MTKFTEENFNDLFGQYAETDTLTISEIKDILLYGGNGSKEKERREFLNTSVSHYLDTDADKSKTILNTRLRNAVICNIITESSIITFNEILQYGVEKLKLRRGVGKVVINYLIQIYKEHGIYVGRS